MQVKNKIRFGANNGNWRGGNIIVLCSYCKKEKSVRRYRGLQDKNHFCNHMCYGKFLQSPTKNLNKKLRDTHQYKVWSKSVKELFGGRCTMCWKFKQLEAHHLIPFRDYVSRHNNVDDAKNDEAMWSSFNGIPLCFDCHSQLDSYRANFKKI
jgi:hypothetical protein